MKATEFLLKEHLLIIQVFDSLFLAKDSSFDGINFGKCGGRICWAVAGTFCNGKAQDTYAEKRDTCINCDFYKLVCAQEGTANFLTQTCNALDYAHNKGIIHRDINPSNIIVLQNDPLMQPSKQGGKTISPSSLRKIPHTFKLKKTPFLMF